VNDVVLSYGYKKEDLIGKSFLEFVPFVREKHRPILEKHVASITNGEIAQGEMELSTPKGRLTMWFRASPMKKRGEIVGFQLILIDITKRKKAEEALKESEQRLRDVIDTSPDGIVWVDTAGKITLVNKKGFEITGFSRKDLIGKNFIDVEALTQESKEKILESFMKRIEGIDTPPYEVGLVTKNGEVLPFELSASPIYEGEKIVGVQAVFRDLRERKRAEEILRESEEKYRKQFEETLDAIFLADAETGIIIDCNRAASELIGREKSELVGKHQRILHPPQKIEGEFTRTFKQHLKEKEGQVLETQVITKKGEIKDVAIKANVFELKGKKLVQGMFRDITERKQMEEKLRESEETFRNLYESIQDPVGIFVGREGHLIEYNNAFKKWSGYSDEELKDKIFLDFVHPEDQAIVLEKYRTEYSEEELPLVYEIKGIKKKGETIPTEISVGTYKKKGRVIGINVMHRDITERKEMERKLQEYAEHQEDMVEERTKELRESQERLIKSERLATIGQLATMVGHDLRNPLAALKNASYYLKMKLPSSKDEKVKKMFGVIDKEINYANNIVKDLMDFSRVKKPELKKVDLISSIQDAVAQLKFPENITLTTKFSEAPAIEADPDQLRRIFQNITLNGVQAMLDGGELTVSTRKNGDFVEVAFTDTGVGIPEENMEKLFTPLFTTKSHGVGLGLPICKNLVDSHNGRIEVKSKVGKGTTFTLKLPIHQNKGGEKQT
jgi:PAS domain S-box